jgi:hypothetical protein
MDTKSQRWIGGAVMTLALLCTTNARAHFTLLQPTSWLKEDAMGSPQKGSPCGPGNTRPFIGDDVQPIPVSEAVTTFHAGETITVAWRETVYHPGYFRISLAKTGAADATSTNFPDPALSDPANCLFDKAAVQTVPHGDVLADGLFMATDQNGSTRSLTQKVKLPDEPCDQCTLQVVQVMDGHPAASCFYFHCADIKILAANGGGAGATATKPASSHKSGGCSITEAGARSGVTAVWCLFGLGSASWLRRRLRRSRA